jgi:hypothetical protein
VYNVINNNYKYILESYSSATLDLNVAQANHNSATRQKNSININHYKVAVRGDDVITYTRVCNGHSAYTREFWVEDADDVVYSWRTTLRGMDKIKSFEVSRDTDKTGWFLWMSEDYTITAKWSHVDDVLADTDLVGFPFFWGSQFSEKCNNYTVVPHKISGSVTYQVTAKSHEQYNAAITLAEGDVQKSNIAIAKAERDVQDSMNRMIQMHQIEERRLLDEQEKLVIAERDAREALSNQGLEAQEFQLKLQEQKDLIDNHRKNLEERLLEKHRLEIEKDLKANQIVFNKQLNFNLEQVVLLLENRNIDQVETNSKIQELLTHHDQTYRDLCANITKSNQEILDKIKALPYDKRAQLVLDSFIENDKKKDVIKKYASHIGFDKDYLARLAFEIDSTEAFEYALSSGADPINYSRNHKTLLQSIIKSGKKEYFDRVINGKSLDDLAGTILSAIKNNDLVTINKLSDHYGNIFSKEIMGVNFIEFVIHNMNEVLLDQVLLINPETVKLTNARGHNALYTALKHGNDSMVMKILNLGLLNAQDQAEILALDNERDLCVKFGRICTKNNIELLHDQGNYLLEHDYYAEMNLLCIEEINYPQDLFTDADFICN